MPHAGGLARHPLRGRDAARQPRGPDAARAAGRCARWRSSPARTPGTRRRSCAPTASRPPPRPTSSTTSAGRASASCNALREGRDVALVSDAGTPGISDPGYRLVRDARAEGLPVVPVPGPSAAIAALSVSGLPTDRFLFVGFLPPRAGARRRALEALAAEQATLVVYESPQRVLDTLAEMAELLGDREAFLCREATKLHEEYVRAPLSALRERLAARESVKGEIVLVVAGAPEHDAAGQRPGRAVPHARRRGPHAPRGRQGGGPPPRPARPRGLRPGAAGRAGRRTTKPRQNAWSLRRSSRTAALAGLRTATTLQASRLQPPRRAACRRQGRAEARAVGGTASDSLCECARGVTSPRRFASHSRSVAGVANAQQRFDESVVVTGTAEPSPGVGDRPRRLGRHARAHRRAARARARPTPCASPAPSTCARAAPPACRPTSRSAAPRSVRRWCWWTASA